MWLAHEHAFRGISCHFNQLVRKKESTMERNESRHSSSFILPFCGLLYRVMCLGERGSLCRWGRGKELLWCQRSGGGVGCCDGWKEVVAIRWSGLLRRPHLTEGGHCIAGDLVGKGHYNDVSFSTVTSLTSFSAAETDKLSREEKWLCITWNTDILCWSNLIPSPTIGGSNFSAYMISWFAQDPV